MTAAFKKPEKYPKNATKISSTSDLYYELNTWAGPPIPPRGDETRMESHDKRREKIVELILKLPSYRFFEYIRLCRGGSREGTEQSDLENLVLCKIPNTRDKIMRLRQLDGRNSEESGR